MAEKNKTGGRKTNSFYHIHFHWKMFRLLHSKRLKATGLNYFLHKEINNSNGIKDFVNLIESISSVFLLSFP